MKRNQCRRFNKSSRAPKFLANLRSFAANFGQYCEPTSTHDFVEPLVEKGERDVISLKKNSVCIPEYAKFSSLPIMSTGKCG